MGRSQVPHLLSRRWSQRVLRRASGHWPRGARGDWVAVERARQLLFERVFCPLDGGESRVLAPGAVLYHCADIRRRNEDLLACFDSDSAFSGPCALFCALRRVDSRASEAVCLLWDACGRLGERVFDQGCHVQGFVSRLSAELGGGRKILRDAVVSVDTILD